MIELYGIRHFDTAHGQNCEIWEHQIDTFVARLYGLPDAKNR